MTRQYTPTKHTNPKEAIKDGAKRYFGNACENHPELNGERNARSRACIGCSKDRMRERRAEDPDYYRRVTRVAYDKWYPKNKDRVRAARRKRKTGFTEEQFRLVYKAQEGKCAVCQRPLAALQVHADHCHGSGAPRGILCGPCNRAEGIIRSIGLSPEDFCRRLAKYLESPPAERLKHVQDYQADQATP